MATAPLAFYQAQVVLHAPFLVLGVLGVWTAFRRYRRSTLGLFWWLLSYTLVYATTLPNARRVRLPAELPLIMLASFGLILLWYLVVSARGRQASQPAWGAGAVPGQNEG
jgi:ABC-type polysaccharide/polyol phosphate export permease